MPAMADHGARKRRKAGIPGEVLAGYQLQLKGQVAEAERLYKQALHSDPRCHSALHQLGLIARERGQHAEALDLMTAAVAADRGSHEALGNHGLILHDLGRHAEAIDSFNRALILKRDNVPALYNRGLAQVALNRPKEALASFSRAIALEPGHADAQFNAAMLHLLLGDFRAGWKQYEWRWRRPEGAAVQRSFAQPLWLGDQPLTDKTILLHAEQGLGDAVQFIRYAPLVAARGARVLVEVPAPLKPLIEGLAGVSAVIARGEPLPAFDLHCPLLSLPLAFATELASVPGAAPYLRAGDDRIAAWAPRLPPRRGLRVGLAWSGNPALKNDRNRSIALARLAPLWDLPDVQVIGLQREPRPDDADVLRAAPQLMNLGDDVKDFADTAAVIAQLDVVVAVDTAVAHLAGALGRPVFVLLPYAPDFRWLIARSDSPWYPTARLLRQPAIGDWEGVVADLCRELTAMTRPA
jgi:tetratricopeptide (TPR) repeat protein